MPIYEYRCLSCQRKVSIYFKTLSSSASPVCPNCGSTHLDRLFSRVVVRRARASDVSDSSEPDFDMGLGDDFGFGDDLYGSPLDVGDDADPRELAAWTRQMSAQTGEPLDPDLDRALTDLERGADPDEVMEQLEQSDPANWGDTE